jgi:hypothetical protein
VGRPISCSLEKTDMKYLIFLLLILSAWALAAEFLLKDRQSEGLGTFTQKLKDLGLRVHRAVGVLAAVAVIVYVVRFLWRVFFGS